MYKIGSDFLGALSSFLCVIHCMISPILIGSTFLLTSHSWEMLSWIFWITCCASVYLSSKSAVLWVRLLFYFFLSVVGLSLCMPHHTSVEILGYFGSAGLILTHLYNFRYKIGKR